MSDKPFDPTKPVMLRSGWAARIICTDFKGISASIIALIDEGNFESVHSYTEKGWYFPNETSPRDLINIPTKKEGWINIYPDMKCSVTIHASKNDADGCAGSDRIACVRIEWEE